MTVHTKILGKTWKLIFFLAVDGMTVFAGLFQVGPCQGKPSLGVKGGVFGNLARHSLDIPAIGDVTLLARCILKALHKRSRVMRLVTTFAAAFRDTPEEVVSRCVALVPQCIATFGLMTIETTVLFVFSSNRKTGLSVVIKFGSRFPRGIRVTG